MPFRFNELVEQHWREVGEFDRQQPVPRFGVAFFDPVQIVMQVTMHVEVHARPERRGRRM